MLQDRIIVNCGINKQLECLYSIAELIESNSSLDSVLKEFIVIVTNAMQVPEKTYVEILVGSKSYKTKQFKKTNKSFAKKVFIDDDEIGTLSVFIDNKSTDMGVNFLPEDKALISYLCERIGRVVHRYRLLSDIESVRGKLQIQNEILQSKNIALSEVLNHIQEEKQKERNKIMHNFEILVFPVLDKMKQVSDPSIFIELLEESLYGIASEYGLRLKQSSSNLTPKEIEICNILKSGKTSKEIGHILNLSYKTVNKHRDNIRIKLGIKNQRINLVSHLNNLQTTE